MKNDWISVYDKNPADFISVLVCNAFGNCIDDCEPLIAHKSKDKWFTVYPLDFCIHGEIEVTHWMPLPEPPKE